MLSYNLDKKIIFSLSLIFLTLGIGASWYSEYFVVDAIPFKLVVVLPVFAITTLILLFSNKQKIPDSFSFSGSQFSLLIFFLFATISFFWSNDKSIFFEKWLLMFSGLYVIFLVSNLSLKTTNLVYIARILSISAFLVSIIGILQYTFKFPSFEILQFGNIPASTFGNKNAANQFLVFTFPLSIYLLIHSRCKVNLFIGSLSFSATLFYIFYSVTKGVWIAVGAQILILLFFVIINSKIRKQLFRPTVFLYILAPLLFFIMLDMLKVHQFGSDVFNNAISTVQERYSNFESPRWGIWRSTISFINESPIYGHGLGNFTDSTINEGIHQKLQRVHNDVLELIFELGFVGLVIFLIFISFFISDILYINKEKLQNTYFFNLLALSLFGSSIHMMVSWPYQTVYGISIAALFFGLISKAAKENKEKFLFSFSLKSSNIFLLLTFLSIFAYSSQVTRGWAEAKSEFWRNSGTQGSKYNLELFKKYLDGVLRKDLSLMFIAFEYYNKGFIDRAVEIYKLSSDNNNLASYRIIIHELNKENIKEAEKYLNRMLKNSRYNPLTFSASMMFYRKTKKIDLMKNFYQEFKKHILDRDTFDYRSYLYLHQWSISLQFYEDTISFYKILQHNWRKEDHIENKMVNYYAYTGEQDKGLPHLKYVLEKSPNMINPIVLKSYIDKGLVTLSNDNPSKK